MMRALGAEVILVDQLPHSIPGQVSGGDLELVNEEAERLAKERGAFRADQFHHEGTGCPTTKRPAQRYGKQRTEPSMASWTSLAQVALTLELPNS